MLYVDICFAFCFLQRTQFYCSKDNQEEYSIENRLDVSHQLLTSELAAINASTAQIVFSHLIYVKIRNRTQNMPNIIIHLVLLFQQ